MLRVAARSFSQLKPSLPVSGCSVCRELTSDGESISLASFPFPYTNVNGRGAVVLLSRVPWVCHQGLRDFSSLLQGACLDREDDTRLATLQFSCTGVGSKNATVSITLFNTGRKAFKAPWVVTMSGGNFRTVWKVHLHPPRQPNFAGHFLCFRTWLLLHSHLSRLPDYHERSACSVLVGCRQGRLYSCRTCVPAPARILADDIRLVFPSGAA